MKALPHSFLFLHPEFHSLIYFPPLSSASTSYPSLLRHIPQPPLAQGTVFQPTLFSVTQEISQKVNFHVSGLFAASSAAFQASSTSWPALFTLHSVAPWPGCQLMTHSTGARRESVQRFLSNSRHLVSR